MDKPEYKKDRKAGKTFLIFAGICILALPLIVLSAFNYSPRAEETELIDKQDMDFDYNGGVIFKNYDRLTRDYLEGTSTGRTLDKYYALRQYPGSPPEVPHTLEVHGNRLECFACHGDGGWTEALKSITPVTPHPEHEMCSQCHARTVTNDLFVDNNWMSIPPPRLGRSELPGAPPPIPHDLQMRGNCIACHVGPGTVEAIRVEHPSRGNCRQCHVPDFWAKPFQRKPIS
jgi:cytochrome c-type protein NapB